MDKLQILSFSAPIIIAVIIMSSGNYNNTNLPIIAAHKLLAYKVIAVFLVIIGLVGFWGPFNNLVNDFDRFWVAYVFAAAFISMFLKKVQNKHVMSKNQGNINGH